MKKKLLMLIPVLLIILVIPLYNVKADTVTRVTIKNTQDNSEQKEYQYHMEIAGVSGAVRYLKDGQEHYLLFSAEGRADFKLKSNESIILCDVPVDAQYKIEQYNLTGYKTYIDGHQKRISNGKMTANMVVTFENKSTAATTTNPATGDSITLVCFIIPIALILNIVLIRKMKKERYQ